MLYLTIMARYDHLPIFKSAYAFCLLAYELTHNFGRDYRYTLGERMKETAHDMLDLLIETNSAVNSEKTKLLEVLILKMEKYRMYARMSCDLKLVSPESLGKVAEALEEMEKQAVGWKNWATKPNA
jgi:hypothetical protein